MNNTSSQNLDSKELDNLKATISQQKKEIFYLQSIIKKLPGSVYWKDKDGIYLGCNDFVFNMAGSNDVIGKTDFELPWKERAYTIFKIDQQVIRTDFPIEAEEKLNLSNGQQMIMLTRKSPLKDEQGQTVGVIGISIDITERKKLEAKANKFKENQFYKIIDAIPGSIYWKDKEGHYLGCNKYMLEKIAGFKDFSDIIGKKDDELPWKNIADKLFEIDNDVINNNKIIEVEESPLLASQKEATFLTTKTPLINKEGEIVGLIGVSVDITDRKKSELDLKKAKEKAEAGNKAKTEFLENMRHDLRTPLIGITGFASIIGDEVQDAKIKEHIKHLKTSSNALLDLINEILDIIKVDSGTIPLLKKKFDLRKRLNEVIHLNQARAHQKNLDLIVIHDPALPNYVIGDST